MPYSEKKIASRAILPYLPCIKGMSSLAVYRRTERVMLTDETGFQMDILQWSRGDIIAAASLLTTIAIAAVSIYRYFRSGPVLQIEIIPPRKNRRNKKDSDRIITVAVTNKGNRPANIWRLQLRTLESRFVFSKSVLNEAIFDDATPWKPTAKVEPHDSKTYDLQFFSGWTKVSGPPEKIEVAVFVRGREKPFVAYSWG